MKFSTVAVPPNKNSVSHLINTAGLPLPQPMGVPDKYLIVGLHSKVLDESNTQSFIAIYADLGH